MTSDEGVACAESKPGPLHGLRVVVTRAADRAEGMGGLLRRRGATVVDFPTIAIVDPESWDALDAAVRRFAAGSYEWLLLTSVNAVESLAARLEAAGIDPRGPATTRVATVGTSTAALATARGLRTDLVPSRGTAADLVEALGSGPGFVLFPRVEGGPRPPVEALERRGWTVDEVGAYRNVPGRPRPEAFEQVTRRRFDAVTFTSASTVRNFAALVSPHELHLAPDDPPEAVVACIGPETAGAALEVGLRVDVEALEHTVPGLVAALCSHVEKAGRGPTFPA